MTYGMVQAPQQLTATGIIVLRLGFNPMAFFFNLCTPEMELNGNPPVKLAWGTHQLAVEPGEHRVRVYFNYLTGSRCGDNEIAFSLAPGQLRTVSFKMPPWAFAAGKMTVE